MDIAWEWGIHEKYWSVRKTRIMMKVKLERRANIRWQELPTCENWKAYVFVVVARNLVGSPWRHDFRSNGLFSWAARPAAKANSKRRKAPRLSCAYSINMCLVCPPPPIQRTRAPECRALQQAIARNPHQGISFEIFRQPGIWAMASGSATYRPLTIPLFFFLTCITMEREAHRKEDKTDHCD